VSEIDVALLMGSASDWKHLRPAVEVLRELGLRFRVHVTSAHRTPQRTVELVRGAEQDGCQVFICAAGMAAHLAGVVASHTVRPVLGIPLPGGVLDGVDALLSTVQMPGGVPVKNNHPIIIFSPPQEVRSTPIFTHTLAISPCTLRRE
jgi:5-(carboxyamino)imidazole ribonucleotide mutase